MGLNGDYYSPTFAGDEDTGKIRVFGVDWEGEMIYYVLGGTMFGIMLAMMTHAAELPLLVQLGSAIGPMVIVTIYAVTLRLGKPPHYDIDWFSSLGWRRSVPPLSLPREGRKLHPWLRERHDEIEPAGMAQEAYRIARELREQGRP